MTLEELDRWLDVYGRAWERQDVDGFVACFADNAVYHWGPWGEPLCRHSEIRLRTEQAIARHAERRGRVHRVPRVVEQPLLLRELNQVAS